LGERGVSGNYYNKKLEQGLEYQDFLLEKLYELGIATISYSSKKYQMGKGENKAGFEIKFDDIMRSSNNIYIETAERSSTNREYVASGIFRSDNTWLYIIGDYDTVFIFGKKHLQNAYHSGKYKTIENKMRTSKGFLLPKSYAEKVLAVKIIKL
jgi:hypothetical protein